ncbi:MAG TPA: class I SAM-dependent methyltransferase, partial [Candidatus Polarisedimenticolaceae bacterium]|nr:class I SAM-dependent methyltransferase [Candidatus Polarisedimenticolaceae bacterium]
YGERLGEPDELGPLYELLGDVLRRRFGGWRAWVLSGNRALDKRLGLRPASRTVLYNGPIECRLLELPIAGAPPRRPGGPAWRKTDPQVSGFAKRLRKNLRECERWAVRSGTDCYRLYDADVPTFNLAVDRYGGAARVEEYERPAGVDPVAADRRLRSALDAVADVLGIARAEVVLRVRRRLAPGEQHGRYGDRGRLREVRERGLRFLVNLEDYLDTGLFLDDRMLRAWLAERARGSSFLNLFAYTCAATVAAARGGARESVSVDLSRRYLDWGRRNLELNGLDPTRHRTVRADVWSRLGGGSRSRRFDLVFVAPPSRSRSKAMPHEFDLRRDHVEMLARLGGWLARGGTVVFASHQRRFELDVAALPQFTSREITHEVTPPDFARRPRLRAWALEVRQTDPAADDAPVGRLRE